MDGTWGTPAVASGLHMYIYTTYIYTTCMYTQKKRQDTHGRKSLQSTLLIVVWWPKFMKKNLKTQKYKNNKMERSELTPNQESCTNRKTSRDAQSHKSWRVTLKQWGAPHICQNAEQHQMLTRTGSSRNSCCWESKCASTIQQSWASCYGTNVTANHMI